MYPCFYGHNIKKGHKYFFSLVTESTRGIHFLQIPNKQLTSVGVITSKASQSLSKSGTHQNSKGKIPLLSSHFWAGCRQEKKLSKRYEAQSTHTLLVFQTSWSVSHICRFITVLWGWEASLHLDQKHVPPTFRPITEVLRQKIFFLQVPQLFH